MGSLIAQTSPMPDQQQGTGLFHNTLHITCKYCHHWHDGVLKLLSLDPKRHHSVSCDNCEQKMFGLGRRSTQLSMLSQETIHSVSALSRRPTACTNRLAVLDDDSQAHFPPRPSESVSRPPAADQGVLTDVNAPESQPEAARGGSGEPDLPDKTNVEGETHSEAGPAPPKNPTIFRVPTWEAETNPRLITVTDSGLAGPAVSVAQGESQDQGRASKRCRIFKRITRGVGRLFGLDVQIEAVKKGSMSPQSSWSSGMSPRAVRPQTEPMSERLPESGRLDPKTAGFYQPRRPSAALSEAQTLRNSMRIDEQQPLNVNEPDPREERRIQERKQDSARQLYIKKIRLARTKNKNITTCNCSAECPCNPLRNVHQPDVDAESNVPSLVHGSRASTYSDSAGSTASTGQSFLVRGAGGAFPPGASEANTASFIHASMLHSSRRSLGGLSSRSSIARTSSIATDPLGPAASRPGTSNGGANVSTGHLVNASGTISLPVGMPQSMPVVPPSPPTLRQAFTSRFSGARSRVSLGNMSPSLLPALNTETILESPRERADSSPAASPSSQRRLEAQAQSASTSGDSVTPTQETVDVDAELMRTLSAQARSGRHHSTPS